MNDSIQSDHAEDTAEFSKPFVENPCINHSERSGVAQHEENYLCRSCEREFKEAMFARSHQARKIALEEKAIIEAEALSAADAKNAEQAAATAKEFETLRAQETEAHRVKIEKERYTAWIGAGGSDEEYEARYYPERTKERAAYEASLAQRQAELAHAQRIAETSNTEGSGSEDALEEEVEEQPVKRTPYEMHQFGCPVCGCGEVQCPTGYLMNPIQLAPEEEPKENNEEIQDTEEIQNNEENGDTDHSLGED